MSIEIRYFCILFYSIENSADKLCIRRLFGRSAVCFVMA